MNEQANDPRILQEMGPIEEKKQSEAKIMTDYALKCVPQNVTFPPIAVFGLLKFLFHICFTFNMQQMNF